jgi:hypothetical protein
VCLGLKRVLIRRHRSAAVGDTRLLLLAWTGLVLVPFWSIEVARTVWPCRATCCTRRWSRLHRRRCSASRSGIRRRGARSLASKAHSEGSHDARVQTIVAVVVNIAFHCIVAVIVPCAATMKFFRRPQCAVTHVHAVRRNTWKYPNPIIGSRVLRYPREVKGRHFTTSPLVSHSEPHAPPTHPVSHPSDGFPPTSCRTPRSTWDASPAFSHPAAYRLDGNAR